MFGTVTEKLGRRKVKGSTTDSVMANIRIFSRDSGGRPRRLEPSKATLERYLFAL